MCMCIAHSGCRMMNIGLISDTYDIHHFKLPKLDPPPHNISKTLSGERKKGKKFNNHIRKKRR
jgi:hypothetical protein